MTVAEDERVVEAPLDEEISAREANIRRWWRRAIGLIVFVMIVSPLSAFVAWRIHLHLVQEENKFYPSGLAGPPNHVLKEMYRQYKDTEDASRRGFNFLNLISYIDAQFSGRAKAISEAELVFYCGEPDAKTHISPNSREYVYYYTRAQPRDSCVICTLTSSDGGPFVLKKIAHNTAAALNTATTKPISTRPAATGPSE